jgi:hypothetical protein
VLVAQRLLYDLLLYGEPVPHTIPVIESKQNASVVNTSRRPEISCAFGMLMHAVIAIIATSLIKRPFASGLEKG